MGIATDGAYIYVTNNESDTVTKLRESNGAFVATYKVGDGPFGIAFDGAYFWVANFGDGNVMKLATDGTLIGTYRVGDGPRLGHPQRRRHLCCQQRRRQRDETACQRRYESRFDSP